MKERPILFSAPMVRAIIERQKTQTRRIIADDWWRCLDPDDDDDRAVAESRCPYGQSGDRLWVRETLRRDPLGHWCYAATASATLSDIVYFPNTESVRWSQRQTRDHVVSIHMPRFASRLLLEIVRVRAERLQEISEADALAEGVSTHVPSAEDARVIGSAPLFRRPGAADFIGGWSARGAYERLWDEINGARANWASNPWVWVVEFKTLETKDVPLVGRIRHAGEEEAVES